MNKGDRIQVEIIDISQQGKGIGKHQGLALFIGETVLGDIVTVEILKLKKNYAIAELISVDTPSKYRVEPPCKEDMLYGGAYLANMSYEGQLLLKEKQIKDKFERIAGISNPVIRPMIAMENPNHYRNKATFAISTGGNIKEKGGVIKSLGEPCVGFYKASSNEVVDINESIIQHQVSMAAARATRQFMKDDNITAWDDKWKQGLMRHMIVKVSFETEEVMVTYIINGKSIPNGQKLIEMLDDEIYEEGFELKSVNLNINKESGKNLYGKDTIPYAGTNTISDRIGELELEISPLAFYQVNPVMCEKLYDKAKEYANLTGKENVLDLYCGVGSIGLYMANESKFVIGIESENQAVLNANRNAVINGIVNARFITGKAEEELPKLVNSQVEGASNGEVDLELSDVAKSADVVILDPPRAGVDSKLIDAVVGISPEKIVYISCDPATLARDVKLFMEKGYEFVEATPADMFPHTLHIETICVLEKR